tara:strand:+ start:68 stop:1123 length:1056 start_codon:yes stop_codon:yes gene_type:complete
MKKKYVKLGKYLVGDGHPPFLIAEISANHNQSIKKIFKLIDKISKSGAHAVKIQTYTPDSMTINIKSKNFKITDKKSPWKGKTLYDIYKKGSTPYKWHKKIFNYAKKRKILCFSTPFDDHAVDFLEKLKTPFYKIASYECVDIPLIEKVSKTRKPIIISTGAANFDEIKEAVKTVRKFHNKLILLKCTSLYPSRSNQLNLSAINNIKSIFNCPVGFSDHTVDLNAAITSIGAGANIIEKHVKLLRNEKGLDSSFSIDVEELRKLSVKIHKAWDSLGTNKIGPVKDEIKVRKRRRSLYFIKNLKKGDIINAKDIKRIRPGYGLPPKFLKKIIGKKIKKNISYGSPIKWTDFK